MRKLATIRKIDSVNPIPDADAIEVVAIGGWKVVTKKGEFSPGDLCVYFEIDSVLPIRDEFEFLRKGCYVKKDWLVNETNPTGEGFRLKTIKLRGQISQGLVVPIDTFLFKKFPEVGDCVDGCINVVKWDPPLPAQLNGIAKGNFPSFIRKTDQERIQNLDDDTLDKYRDDDFEVTVKLDGSSMTIYMKDGLFGVCSRNLELDLENDPNTTFAKVAKELNLEYIIGILSTDRGDGLGYLNVAIQGELMGPGIQGNRENLMEHEFFVFDIYDIDHGCYLNQPEREIVLKMINIINAQNGTRPLIHCPVWDNAFRLGKHTRESLLEMAAGKSLNHKIREGLVFKSVQHPDFSFKAISNEFLLKGGE